MLAPAVTRLSGLFSDHIANLGCVFYQQDTELLPEDITSADCYLPVILWEAEKLITFSAMPSLKPMFTADAASFLGISVNLPDDPMTPRSPLPLFCIEVIANIMENHPHLNGASLDEVTRNFLNDANNGLLPGIGIAERVSVENPTAA